MEFKRTHKPDQDWETVYCSWSSRTSEVVPETDRWDVIYRTVCPGYGIKERLVEGGFGTVYRAERKMDRRVRNSDLRQLITSHVYAIKVVKSSAGMSNLDLLDEEIYALTCGFAGVAFLFGLFGWLLRNRPLMVLLFISVRLAPFFQWIAFWINLGFVLNTLSSTEEERRERDAANIRPVPQVHEKPGRRWPWQKRRNSATANEVAPVTAYPANAEWQRRMVPRTGRDERIFSRVRVFVNAVLGIVDKELVAIRIAVQGVSQRTQSKHGHEGDTAYSDLCLQDLTPEQKEQMRSDKRLYHQLRNIEDHPSENAVVLARRRLSGLLDQTITEGLRDPLGTILDIPQFSSSALRRHFRAAHTTTVNKYKCIGFLASTHDFFPEALGFNMAYETLPYHLLVTSREQREHGINDFYFALHVTIDNPDTGHAALPLEAVEHFLLELKEREGPAAMEQKAEWTHVRGILTPGAALVKRWIRSRGGEPENSPLEQQSAY
ncbi:hypothetical protein EHS25_005732 [Saitozyma podzolica]|uniref:Protein kinase domain-containing protein n=1 Tax=Saitozyma podzolica TaxID=1890683 RepID=A0A427XW16_9TREE|nr:hypothetical protein EHS25_005732 [Saitozyma podzolica]